MNIRDRAIAGTRDHLMSNVQRRGWRNGLAYLCEGQGFLEHQCDSPVQLNEVLIPRNVFQKLSNRKQAYFFHPINCAFNCQGFHTRHGHTKAYADWHRIRMVAIYGASEVTAWLLDVPLKVKPR